MSINKNITTKIISLKLSIDFIAKLRIIADIESKKLNLDITVMRLILKVIKDFEHRYMEGKNEKM